MKKMVISIYIIFMILALNCYSPFLTYNASLWNNLSFEREYQSDAMDSRIYAAQKAFEEAHLAYTRTNRNQDQKQPFSNKMKTKLRVTQEVDRNFSEPVNDSPKTPKISQKSENKKLALLKIGVKKEKIIDGDDVENASFSRFT